MVRQPPPTTMVIAANVKIERAASEIPNGSYATVSGVSLDVHMAPDSAVHQQLSAIVLAAWKKSRGAPCTADGQACGKGGRSRLFEDWTVEDVQFKGGPVAPSAMATDGAYSFTMKCQARIDVSQASACPCSIQ
jgi:hypothetical protein